MKRFSLSWSNLFLTMFKVCYSSKIAIIISVGKFAGLPEFRQIARIVVINTEILFVCKLLTSWYTEHMRVNELCCSGAGGLTVTQLTELNDVFPLSAYKVKGNAYVVLKRHVLL